MDTKFVRFDPPPKPSHEEAVERHPRNAEFPETPEWADVSSPEPAEFVFNKDIETTDIWNEAPSSHSP